MFCDPFLQGPPHFTYVASFHSLGRGLRTQLPSSSIPVSWPSLLSAHFSRFYQIWRLFWPPTCDRQSESSLIILIHNYDEKRLDRLVVPSSPSASGVVSCCLGFFLRFCEITCFRYTFFKNVSWICVNSSFLLSTPQILLACSVRNHIVPDFTCGWLCDVKWVYLPVWVGFLYTAILNLPPSLFARTSRKLTWLLVSSSFVNWICWWCLLRWAWNSSSWSVPHGHRTNMSSRYVHHTVGVSLAEERALLLKPANQWMTRLVWGGFQPCRSSASRRYGVVLRTRGVRCFWVFWDPSFLLCFFQWLGNALVDLCCGVTFQFSRCYIFKHTRDLATLIFPVYDHSTQGKRTSDTAPYLCRLCHEDKWKTANRAELRGTVYMPYWDYFDRPKRRPPSKYPFNAVSVCLFSRFIPWSMPSFDRVP